MPSLTSRVAGVSRHAFRAGRGFASLLTLSLLLCSAGLAQAAVVTSTLYAGASYTLDPAGAVVDENNGPQAQATYGNAVTGPGASATARRRQVSVDVAARGDSFSGKHAAEARSTGAYELWSLSDHRALTFDEAAGLTLSFDFRLIGGTSAGGDSHERDMSYAATVQGTERPWINTTGDSGYLVCGIGCLGLRNTALLDSEVDQSFSLLHSNDNLGSMSLRLTALGSISADLEYDLSLEAIRLVPGTPLDFALLSLRSSLDSWTLGDGLAVRFVDSGELVVVVPADVTDPGNLPEPGSLGLLAAGGFGLLLWRRVPAARVHRA